jgi:hypothetical protein
MHLLVIILREFQRRDYISDFVRHGKSFINVTHIAWIKSGNTGHKTKVKIYHNNAKLLPQMSSHVHLTTSVQNWPTCYIYLLFGIFSCLQYAVPPQVFSARYCVVSSSTFLGEANTVMTIL